LNGFGFTGAAACCKPERSKLFTVTFSGWPVRRISFSRRLATSSSMVSVVRTS
jgi:hypothetical protein